ncbi:MAG: hypothetical protein IJT65_03255 [Eubacterium sp.]|nr:hypothetical protein [Eubacterium sp.]
MKTIKYICFVFLIALLLFSNTLNSYAKSEITVTSENQCVMAGETVTIPVSLENNTGITGFRITFIYPKDAFETVNVSSGSLTETGSFNTTISDYSKVNGSFDVLWSSTENVTKNGTLCLVTLKAKNTAKPNKYTFNIKYTQEDTFDESFKDVKLNCKPFYISISENKKNSKVQSNKSSVYANEASGDYLVFSVNQAVKSNNFTDLNSLNEKQKAQLLEDVNTSIEKFGASKRYDSFNELIADYSEAALTDLKTKAEVSPYSEQINNELKEILKEYRAGSFLKISEKDKKESTNKALAVLKKHSVETAGEYFGSSSDLARCLDEIITGFEAEKNSEASGKRTLLTAASIVVIVLVLLTLFVIVLKRKRKK